MTAPSGSAPTARKDDTRPLVTVVIPARDEEPSIGRCLDAVLAQDWTNLQVLVVDGASTDDTVSIVQSYADRDPRVELLSNPRGVIPVSLNLALNHAKGEWLVRVDAHARIPSDYVRLAAEHLMTGRYGGVGGRKDGVGRTPAGKAVAAAMASRFGVGGSTYHHGTAVTEVEHVPFGAYPVALARALGGWDEGLRVNQDFEFDHRVRQAGHVILFDPALHIDWECRQSIRAFARQYRRYGGGKVNVAIKHPSSLKPRHLAAPALIVQCAAVMGALLAGRPGRAAVLISPYVAALTAAYVTTSRKVEPEARPYLVPAFLAMHLGWGVGFWQQAGRRAVAAARGATWQPTGPATSTERS